MFNHNNQHCYSHSHTVERRCTFLLIKFILTSAKSKGSTNRETVESPVMCHNYNHPDTLDKREKGDKTS